ncbi:MAG: fimbrial biosis outer rane usher protein [Myxococcales bacterium]|nr:fimbrial biosis outer rane usher protein [Myxococcales bacterium]
MLGRAVARPRSTLLVLILILILIAARASAQPTPAGAGASATDAEVFERVFKTHRGSQHAPVMLVVDGFVVAPIVIELARPDASPIVPSAPILAAVSPKLGSDAARRLAAVLRTQRVSVDVLRTVGLEVVYDVRKLELQITIPPSLTKRASHDLGRRSPPDAVGAVRPSDVSGYVNVTARAAASAPVHVALDSALNVEGWVLQGRADVVHQSSFGMAPVGVHRGDVLVSRDVPAHALRYVAGDFAVPFAGLQPSFPVIGVGVIRNFAMQPYRVVQPVGAFEFVLETPSTVTVVVNGAPVQTLALPAGRHDLRDLPLAAGVNEVELVIRDQAGLERRVSFSLASPNELLAPGVVQFSLTAGFPLVDDAGLRSYDFSRPILSGRRRWGVTSRMTVGASLDSSLQRHRAGGELAMATTLGNLALDASASCDLEDGCGHAESLRYDYTRGARGTTSTIAIVGRHTSSRFHDITSVAANRYSNDVSVSTIRGLSERLIARLTARYQVGRAWPDAQELSLGLSHSFGRLGLNALVAARNDGIASPEARIFVSAQWALPERQGSVHALSRASTATGIANEITYTTSGGPPPGRFVSSITLKQSARDVDAAGTVGYTGDRFTSSVSLGTAVGRDHGGVAPTASVEASTALAFAGGRAAWSRPIAGSFAIIERHRVLDGVSIQVNPVLGGHAAETDSFGLAVVPNLEPYRVGRITVAAPMLPLGASLGPELHVVLPTYRSGTLIRVGEEGTVFLRGTLVDPDSQALAFAVGEVNALDHHDRPAIPLMTNRAGRFSVMGLTPGRYAIRLSGAGRRSAEVVIPAGFSGVFSAGTITVREAASASDP